MLRVKMLKDLVRYNILGYDRETLTASKDQEIEVSSKQHMDALVKSKLAVPVEDLMEDEPISDDTGGSGDSDKTEDDFFNLDADAIALIRGLGKDEIEAILRGYNVEIDRRHGLASIRKQLIEIVGSSLPEEAAGHEDAVGYLITYYNDTFKISLDKALYTEENLSKLTEDMHTILTQALEDDNS